MTADAIFDAAVDRLHQTHLRIGSGDIPLPVEPSVEAKQEVLARFQPLFAAAHLPDLTEAEFRDFLIFRNNRHWSGLQRLGPRMCHDMESLRAALAVLLDESRPIEKRYDYAIGSVNGLGRAVATAILQVVYPDTYGVWNTTSEGGLKILDLWPRFDRGEPEGSRYAKVNELLLSLAEPLGVDLWTLDAVWYYLLAEVGMPEPIEENGDGPLATPAAGEQGFRLERHLHDFLRDNWDHTELGRRWALYREPGNEDAGYEYFTTVGRIDLLARHRTQPRWLIVELKREQTSDQTVGQVMRYMGWVARHLAEAGEEVRGLIIAHSADPTLAYAVTVAANVDVMLYQVHFHLEAAPEPVL